MATSTTEKTRTWPTVEEVEKVYRAVDDAENELDEFRGRCHGLIDANDPLEAVPGVPAPTVENIAALAIASQRLRDEIEELTWHVDKLDVFLEAAVYLRREA